MLGHPRARRFSFFFAFVAGFAVVALSVAALGQDRPSPQLGPALVVTQPPGGPALATAPAPEIEPRAPWSTSWFDTTSRSAIATAYLTYLAPTVPTSVGWTGSVTPNNPGSTSSTYQSAALQRINWFRALAGVPSVITFNSTYSAADQQAALMMSANGQLSHNPPSNWTDYTAAGANAAANSNICMGYDVPEFLSKDPGCVQGYMDDDGSNNTEVGHRRWLLVPQTQQMGTGDVTQYPASANPPIYWSANAVWVQDGHYGDPRPATRENTFVAWPPKGYVPYQVVPTRWSLSYANADFTNATVTMTVGSANVPVTLLTVQPTYGSGYYMGENTLVWVPSIDFALQPSSDTSVNVTVSGIAGVAPSSSYSYTVIIFDPNSGSTLQPPTLVSPSNGATSQPTSGLTLSWSASTGAASYDIYVGSPTPSNIGNTTSTSVTVNGLSQSTTYSWYIVAKSGSSTAQSSTWTFTTVGPPPAPILSLPANGATGVATSASLNWASSSGATSYDVYFGTSSSPSFVTNTNSLSYSPSLAAGTTYYWQVAARNSNGSTASSIWSFTTLSNLTAPTLVSPSNGATSQPASSLTLSWNASSGATSYDVYVGSPTPSNIGNTTSTSVTVGGLSQSTTYSWYIVARSGSSTAQSSTWTFTTVGPPPAPVLTSPTNGATGVATSVPLNWSSSSGATSYDVYFGTASSPPYVTNTTSLSYSPSLAAGTTYYWKVAAKNSNGSTASSIWSFTTLSNLTAPILVSPVNGTTGRVTSGLTLSWNASAGATSYDVYLGSPTPNYLGNVTGTSTTVNGLSTLTTYSWYIVAKNGSTTATSATWTFMTAGTVPPAPVLTSPTNGATGAATSASLNWGSSSSATSYDVYFGTANPPGYAANTTSLTYSPSLAAGTTYYWFVIAKNSYASTASSTWSFTTAAGGGPPAAPALVSPGNAATGVAVTGAQLTWSAATGATSYDVYIGTANPPPYSNNITGTSATITSTLSAGTKYYWQIVARNSYGTTASAVWSFTTYGGSGPGAVSLSSPINGAPDVALTGVRLTWAASSGATAYEVYIGTSNPPPDTGSVSGSPANITSTLMANTTYYWYIVASNSYGSATSPTWSFTTTGGGNLNAPSLTSPANGATSVPPGVSLNWSAASGATSYDVYFGSSSSPAYVTNTTSLSYTPAGLVAGSTYYWKIVANNGSTTAASSVWSFTVASGTASSLLFVPVSPCRVIDTRSGQGTSGAFGPPIMGASATRTFPIPQGRCSIPSTAQAYSVNVTVVPASGLGYLSMWPSGQSQPVVSTLNAPNGGIVANAAIVPAGSSGAISVYVTDQTDVIVDINGYFDSSNPTSAYAFYPAAPCRVADTRNATGMFGGPTPAGGTSRDFPVPSSSCNIPATATAYSTNVTVVPSGPLGYLTLWPTGQAQPYVSTLNSPSGNIVANAALVPAGTNGSVSAFVTNSTDIVLDINGYFAAAGYSGALTFYPVSPCRVIDTRNANGTFGGPILAAGGTRPVPVPSSACNIPSSAQAYSMNFTVVPQGPLGYLSVWPVGQSQPFVSTLNSDGRIVANAAIVPAGTGGAIDIYATNATHVIVDINGYFAP